MIKKFKLLGKRILHLTHNDLDGYGPEVIVKSLGENLKVKKWDFVNLNNGEMDWKIRNVCTNFQTFKDYDYVIITDISCGKETAEKIVKSVFSNRVMLLDHHATAMWLNDYPFACVREHDIKTLPRRGTEQRHACGTSLFWEFMLLCCPFIRKLPEYDTIGQFVSLVSEWDTWDWHNLYGDNPEAKKLNDLCTAYDRSPMFDSNMAGNIKKGVLYSEFDERLLELLHFRTAQYISDLKKDKEYRTVSCRLNTEGGTYRMWIASANDFVSDVFDWMRNEDKDKAYDVYAVDFGSGLSFRSPNDTDVSKLALLYGGGGHKDAAGFRFKGEKRSDYILRMLSEKGKVSCDE